MLSPWHLVVSLICFASCLALLAVVFHQLLCLTDLEVDHLSPFEATAQINKLILPEFILQGALCIVLLLTGHWVMFLVAAPIAWYHGMLFVKRRHLIDVTEVFRNLNFEKKYRLIKLGFYIFLFAIFIFSWLYGLSLSTRAVLGHIFGKMRGPSVLLDHASRYEPKGTLVAFNLLRNKDADMEIF